LFFWQCYGWKLFVSNLFGKVGMLGAGVGGGGGGPGCWSYLYLYLKICALQNFGACTIVVSEGRYQLVSSSLSSSFPPPLITSANHYKGHRGSGLLNHFAHIFSPFHPSTGFFFFSHFVM
jgi:hypothetical protein